VFLDTECAFYGDSAFDIAFCLNHLLLKCLWTPQSRDGFVDCYRELAHAYLASVDWESPQQVECRAAHLLPGLFLARIDGKSRVEYITREKDRRRVRSVATSFLETPTSHLDDIAGTWLERLAGHTC